MMGVLVVVAGPAAGRRIDLGGPVTVGRREGDVLIEDSEISRRHCTIAPGPHEEVVITDLNSTNGTWINGARIAGPTVVRPGDEVRFGDSICRLEVPAATADGATRFAGDRAAATAPAVGAAPHGGAPPPPAAPAAGAAPYAAAPATGGGAPAQPFGAFAPVASVSVPVKPRRRAAATRLPAGVVFAWAVVGVDAIALIVYFAAR